MDNSFSQKNPNKFNGHIVADFYANSMNTVGTVQRINIQSILGTAFW